MLDYGGEDSDIPKIIYRGLRDYHLRSALTSSNLSSGDVPIWESRLKREVLNFENNFKITHRDPSSILGHIFNNSIPCPSYGPEYYHAGQALRIESFIYPSMPMPSLTKAAEMLMSEKLITKYMMPSIFFQRAVIVSNAMNAGKDPPPDLIQTASDASIGIFSFGLSPTNIVLRVGAECFGVELNDHRLSIHHIDHLRNWSDKCTERLNIELACIFGHDLNPLIYPAIETIHELWGIWDGSLMYYGNDMYKCIKLFEALAVGTILEKNPNDIIKPLNVFRATTSSDFIQIADKQFPHLIQPVKEMIKFLDDVNSMQYLAQMYGLYRSWGHPVVNNHEGMAKVFLLGQNKKPISEVIPRQVRRMFLIKYFIWYKRTKGSYPEVVDSSAEPENNDVYCYIKRDCSIATLRQSSLMVGWDTIRPCQCIDIPTTFNLAEMVSDKAISPDRDGLYKLCTGKGNMYDANLRRGVLQWLTRDSESCAVFLKRVNDFSLDSNELIIGLYQKEREVNEVPRMFALMSHSIRNYIVTTEAMLSGDILPAFDHITMTNSLLALQKKIYSISHRQALNSEHAHFKSYREVTIIVNIDFEKWNLNFRRETTYPLFEAIGDLYGLENLFNRTYDVFENSLIYLADGSYKPRVNTSSKSFELESPLSFTNHLGGFEGLRQKGWTIFTDNALDLICSRHKCSYVIMGQGDNQVLALTWKTYGLNDHREVSESGKASLTKQFSAFMNDLVETFGAVGLPVKALETWSSEHLFLYGKIPTLKGVPLSMSLKKICRAYYLANEEIMTLDCSVATIQSNAMAACMSDVNSCVPYVIYKIQLMCALKAYSEYHVLLGKPAFNFLEGDSWRFTTSSGSKSSFCLKAPISKWKFLVALSWFPKILGGLSIACWFDFIMRGFPDKVSLALTWIYLLLQIVTDLELNHSLNLIYQTHINSEKNFVLLVEDPCALNLVVPVDARMSVRQSVQELFENLSEVRNTEFASMFTFSKSWDKQMFCTTLCKGDILHPRFLHDLASATLGGYVDSVVSKVSKASTINKIALRSSSRNPGRKIELHESNYMIYLVWKVSKGNDEGSRMQLTCPTSQARQLRLRSWDKILEGVTVPFPLAFLEFRDCNRDRVYFDTCDLNYISVTLPESFCTGDLREMHKLGHAPPYLGSETKEKIGADPARQVYGKEPLISRPLRLLRVVNWFVPMDSHAKRLIDALLTAVSDLDPNEYISREMGITGSEAHRYRDQALKHGVMSANMYTLGSHMHLSTDTWVKYTRGAENYTINYQAVLCALQSLVGHHLFRCYEEHLIPARQYHFHESCLSCVEILTDEFHDLANEDALRLVPSGRGNKYLWIEGATLTQKYKRDPIFSIEIPDISYNDYAQMINKRDVLTRWLCNDIIDDLRLEGSDSSPLRLLESRDYPRVMYKKLSVQELWETLAIELIAEAGVNYTSGDHPRITYIGAARELAADDIMKCSPKAFMGAAMFYTWPDKFAEILAYDETAVFPDTIPPTLESCCYATRCNLRDIIRRVHIRSQKSLILPRSCKDPGSIIKRYWYKQALIRDNTCPQCLKLISNVKLSSNLKIHSAMRCKLGHILNSMIASEILSLTASEDKLLKDATPSDYINILESRQPLVIHRCPAVSLLLSNTKLPTISEIVRNPNELLRKNTVWSYCGTLPTISKCRTLEILSVLNYDLQITMPAEGVIFGDGLGTSSSILSTLYPNTSWIAASLQDSAKATPQSYAHVLIPQNPIPYKNVDYTITKGRYNDLTNLGFLNQWKDWVKGGCCWCEAEVKINREILIYNLLQLCEWHLLIIRLDFIDYEDALNCILAVINHSENTYVYQTGSLDIKRRECLIISTNTSKDYQQRISFTSSCLANEFIRNSDELFPITAGLEYGEYLVSLESRVEIATMLRRCDQWFAEVGITHLLLCKKLLTPVWWDLQTGKLPLSVKHLGINKTYYMYRSDVIALQARLVILSISMIRGRNEFSREMERISYWMLEIRQVENKVVHILHRSERALDYGPDNLNISKFAQILRKLNQRHGRWWSKCPSTLTFHNRIGEPGMWISRLSQLLPVNIAEIL
ncbi:TPA_asm: L [Rhopalocnemis gammacytorhabdovirus 1]|nr:TPA_asm: L [Rhopalocnemis gammacytorhabdovirus 1]